MGWSIGYDTNWNRDIGYAVPATCDHPDCNAVINRGLGYVCGGEPYGGDHGCGLFFCGQHQSFEEFGDGCAAVVCDQCQAKTEPFTPKPDLKRWMVWKLLHQSWAQWRDENPDEVDRMTQMLKGFRRD